ncbi:retrotransposon gag protein, partial [Trifolium medium]|nr:retrotransposon gag protein [Trifolium medium]
QREQRDLSVTLAEGGIFEDFSSESEEDMDEQQVEPEVGMPEPDIIGIANDRGRSIRDYAVFVPNATEDAFRLRLFPYSLRDRAKSWLNSLEPNSIATWNALAEKFLAKYFPPVKNA